MAAATVNNHLAHLSALFSWITVHAPAGLLRHGDPTKKVDLLRLPAPQVRALAGPLPGPTPRGQAALVRAAVTTTAVYCIVKLPPTASMAAPMPASNSSSVAGGIWPWPPKVGICSSHSSRV